MFNLLSLKRVNNIKVTKSMTIKVIVLYLLILGLGIFSVSIFVRGIKNKKEYQFKYQEQTKLDYKVELKENEYFETPVLESGGNYISSLINKIIVDFNYDLTSNDLIDGSYDYKIVATMEAKEKGKNAIVWSKDTTLYESEESNFTDSNNIDFATQIEVDYNNFNMTMNDFRRAYGLSIDGSLTVSLIVNSRLNHDMSTENIPNENKSSITIPLMEDTTEINMNYNPLTSKENTIEYKGNVVLHYVLIICGVILFIYYLFMSYCLVALIYEILVNQDKYTKKINKLFHDYDEIIVKVKTYPEINNKNILQVDNFEELLDVNVSLKKPIIYYEVKKNRESRFLIIDDDRVFMYVIRYTDFYKRGD